jgi:hypothetical protein
MERHVGLSQPQRVALYELVTSSLKVADTLAAPAPPRPRSRRPPAWPCCAHALRPCVTAAIRPALTQFYEALDQGQKVQFAGMR